MIKMTDYVYIIAIIFMIAVIIRWIIYPLGILTYLLINIWLEEWKERKEKIDELKNEIIEKRKRKKNE